MKRNRRIAILLVLAMSLTMILSVGAVWAAVGGGEIQPYTVFQCTRSFEATSSTSAEADVYGVSSGIAEYITSLITLESAPLGTTSFTKVDGVNSKIKTVLDTSSIRHICDFPITSDREYRIKIELTDKVNGMEITATYYCALTR